MSDITWTTEQRRLGDLKDWQRNPRQLSKHDAEHIEKSITRFGLADPLIVNADNTLIGGHQRKKIIADPELIVDVRVPSRMLTEQEVAELNIRLNRNQGEWDFDVLANQFELDDLIEWGFRPFEMGIINDDFSPEDEWRGMPEFGNNPKAIRTIYIHFRTMEDFDDFKDLIGQKITNKTKSIWYPEAEEQDNKSMAFKNES